MFYFVLSRKSWQSRGKVGAQGSGNSMSIYEGFKSNYQVFLPSWTCRLPSRQLRNMFNVSFCQIPMCSAILGIWSNPAAASCSESQAFDFISRTKVQQSLGSNTIRLFIDSMLLSLLLLCILIRLLLKVTFLCLFIIFFIIYFPAICFMSVQDLIANNCN